LGHAEVFKRGVPEGGREILDKGMIVLLNDFSFGREVACLNSLPESV